MEWTWIDFVAGAVTGAFGLDLINTLRMNKRLKDFRKKLAVIIIEEHRDFHRTDYNSQEWRIDAAKECRAAYDEWAKEVLKNGKREE